MHGVALHLQILLQLHVGRNTSRLTAHSATSVRSAQCATLSPTTHCTAVLGAYHTLSDCTAASMSEPITSEKRYDTYLVHERVSPWTVAVGFSPPRRSGCLLILDEVAAS